MTMKRGNWKKRGKNFSDLGVLLECGKRYLTTTKNVLHFDTGQDRPGKPSNIFVVVKISLHNK